jgi:hypothetical protein
LSISESTNNGNNNNNNGKGNVEKLIIAKEKVIITVKISFVSLGLEKIERNLPICVGVCICAFNVEDLIKNIKVNLEDFFEKERKQPICIIGIHKRNHFAELGRSEG